MQTSRVTAVFTNWTSLTGFTSRSWNSVSFSQQQIYRVDERRGKYAKLAAYFVDLYLLSCFSFLSQRRHLLYSSPALTIQRESIPASTLLGPLGHACLLFDLTSFLTVSLQCSLCLWCSSHLIVVGFFVTCKSPSFFAWWFYSFGNVKEKTHPGTSQPRDTDFHSKLSEISPLTWRGRHYWKFRANTLAPNRLDPATVPMFQRKTRVMVKMWKGDGSNVTPLGNTD